VRDQIAKESGVGSNTVSRVEKLIEKAPAPVIEKLRKGEVSINEAFTSLKYAEKEAQREKRKKKMKKVPVETSVTLFISR
jgi:DNA-binding LacI/PurR family transcriptional regulator